MPRLTWPQLVEFLKQHYSAPLDVSFKQFRLGAMLFFTGGVIIYISANLISASASQEALLLGGLIIGGIGFIIAMMAQVRMLISRIYRFFRDDL